MMTAMLPVQRPTPPKRRMPVTLMVWAVALAAIVLLTQLSHLLARLNLAHRPLGFFLFLSWCLFIGLTLYGFAVGIRWLLRKLFWTVGRRLALSYFMIGLMPFVVFAILLVVILYVIAGVASQASFRAERQASIGQLESQNFEYALQNQTPRGMEIYDSRKASGKNIPEWLRTSSYSGLVLRDGQPVMVAARQYPMDGENRTVVLAQPMDRSWVEDLQDRTGMIVWPRMATSEGDSFDVRDGDKGKEKDDDEWSEFSSRGFKFGRIIFFDITERGTLNDWTSGEPRGDKRVFTAISNPLSNLSHFYFGGATSSQIMRVIFGFIGGLATFLMIIYFFASAFAAVLIFSISRAVNRIEKGTKAVERGDFTYRINMKPHNQLGEMAQSFDRMTESIASLLSTVAEKERLQSEIEIAASIQRNLLPKEGPQFRGVSFSAHFEPTASIGGDYYDVFNLDKSRLAVAIGDVSGHGLSTGLVMAMVKAAITTLVEEGADETSLFQRLNELVYRSTERRAFMTLAFTIFDLEHGTIRHTNAGHLYPYLLRKDAQLTSLECPSLPLGVRSEIVTRTVELPLAEGDAIVYLSDGIVEAQNSEGDPFGFDQLEALLAQQSERSPNMIRDAILQAVARHSGSRPADDDRTVMVLRFDNLRTAPAVEEPELATATS
jgi:serine phosphatase RsbU (regulator of sigma subunit)